MKIHMDHERAKGIGRALFHKYDLGKRGILGPKQCYEVFSDFCYRILTINPQPTMEEANSMHEVLDYNKDRNVTQSDFENLAIRYLCNSDSYALSSGSGLSSNSSSSTVQYSTVNAIHLNKTSSNKQLSTIARKRIDVARRLFEMFDKDRSGFLTEDEIPFIIQETYKEMGQVYKPTKEDVKSYMKMVDADNDGKVSLQQFQEIILTSLKKAGIEIYE